ncbi:unnamed protein product [Tetraodon nigroviridis]|uniref:(spotted green pufferfish) hypothetical protein n=1 Tax=Tetraodon nigroviridis TaxID=99883 RepID=Q4RL14_TETNG|nr:unnamed protein product [Tetraodon nigroviridis]
MAPETRNGGTSTFNNNNNGVDNSKRKVLIVLDVFCLLLGKFVSAVDAKPLGLCYNLI